jgi:3-deoxy-D-glycero-D-galacto-nononate 9-phosphatase
MLPKLVITDIDGVWTDGGMYYDETGNEFKKFNTSDSAGVLFCKRLNIPIAIITGEKTGSAKARAEKLKIEYFFAGIADKLACANDLCLKLGLTLRDIAFIGDDLTDMPLLQNAGLSACPSNAPEYVKNICKWNIAVAGGQGAFRAFIERILVENNKLDEMISSFMNKS